MTSSDDRDLLLALRLFDGKLVRRATRTDSNYHSSEQGLFGLSFRLTADERRESHSALCRLLLTKRPPEDLLGRLAAAFAPNGDPNAGPVKISVGLRGANAPDKELHAAQVIVEVQAYRSQGMSLADALANFDEVHGYKGAARQIWESRKWRELKMSITAAIDLPEKGDS